MEPIHFELTPAQKGMLASLVHETGQPAPTLAAAITAALEELHDQEQHNGTNGHETAPATAVPSSASHKPIWEVADELFGAIPDAELALFPTDGATQHDH